MGIDNKDPDLEDEGQLKRELVGGRSQTISYMPVPLYAKPREVSGVERRGTIVIGVSEVLNDPAFDDYRAAAPVITDPRHGQGSSGAREVGVEVRNAVSSVAGNAVSSVAGNAVSDVDDSSAPFVNMPIADKSSAQIVFMQLDRQEKPILRDGPINADQLFYLLNELQRRNVVPNLNKRLNANPTGLVVSPMEPFGPDKSGDVLFLHTGQGSPMSAIWFDGRDGFAKEVSMNKNLRGADAVRSLPVGCGHYYLGRETVLDEVPFYSDAVAQRQVAVSFSINKENGLLYVVFGVVQGDPAVTEMTKFRIPDDMLRMIGDKD